MITLVPYVKAPDGYTITDEVLKRIFNKLHQDQTFNTVFYEGSLKTELDFINFMKNDRNLPLVLLVNNEIAGLAWLNGLASGYAFSHFVFFKETWGKYTGQMGEQLLNYWMTLGDGVLKTLIGMVPSFNPKAIQFAERMGYTKIGTIPKLIPTPRGQVDITLLYYQR